MSKCILTGQETNNLCYILRHDVYICESMEELVKSIIAEQDSSKREKMFNELVANTKVHNAQAVSFIMELKQKYIIDATEKDKDQNVVEENIIQDDTNEDAVSNNEVNTSGNFINGRDIEVIPTYGYNKIKEVNYDHGKYVNIGKFIYTCIHAVAILVCFVIGIAYSIIFDEPSFLAITFVCPLIIVLFYFGGLFIYEWFENQAAMRNDIENIKIHLNNQEHCFDEINDSLREIARTLSNDDNQNIK